MIGFLFIFSTRPRVFFSREPGDSTRYLASNFPPQEAFQLLSVHWESPTLIRCGSPYEYYNQTKLVLVAGSLCLKFNKALRLSYFYLASQGPVVRLSTRNMYACILASLPWKEGVLANAEVESGELQFWLNNINRFNSYYIGRYFSILLLKHAVIYSEARNTGVRGLML